MRTDILAPRRALRSRGCATVIVDELGRPRCYTQGTDASGRDLEAELAVLAPEFVQALRQLVHALALMEPAYAARACQPVRQIGGSVDPLADAMTLLIYAERRGLPCGLPIPCNEVMP